MKQDEPHAINPNLDYELKEGLINAGLVFFGTIMLIGGTIIALLYLYIGDAIWLIGAWLISLSIRKNYQSIYGKGFRTFNIVTKSVLLFIMGVLIILVNLASLSGAFS